MYKLIYSPQAQKDAKKIASSKLKPKVEDLLEIIKRNPYAFPPTFEFLSGKLAGFMSRRINKQHRLVYQVIEDEKLVKILRMWTHYEQNIFNITFVSFAFNHNRIKTKSNS